MQHEDSGEDVEVKYTSSEKDGNDYAHPNNPVYHHKRKSVNQFVYVVIWEQAGEEDS